RMKMNFPVLLDMEAPEVYAYSIYSVIAEKFEAFVSLGLANGRYKDFYDIYVLSEKYDFDGTELQNAIMETFSHRGTGFNDIVAFEPEFTEDFVRQNRWNSFIKKKKAMIKVEFKDAIEQSKNLFLPIVTAICNIEKFQMKWNKDKKEWI
ncbi:MAG: nucleotidyl transferase AbiEii/AbiGii toxin family protein, partial [Lachnospiraceae bacterium]|nr:nucleotidyl transferase AbiEii/AbiGii toxin family protein [Lachnospiraceae bacterium]